MNGEGAEETKGTSGNAGLSVSVADTLPLVLGDDASPSISVRMGFFLPLGTPFLHDVLDFLPADFGSSLDIKLDILSETAFVFLRKVR